MGFNSGFKGLMMSIRVLDKEVS